METKLLKKRVLTYLGSLYGFLLLGWLLAIGLPQQYRQTVYAVIWGIFSVLPVLATLLTRAITKDHSPWYLKPNFRNHWKTYLFSAFIPGVTIFLGGVLYFNLFPQDLDLTARNLVAQFGQYGAPESLLFNVQTVFIIGFVLIVISPLIFPVHIFALGEEIGWRGYLLPILLKLTGQRKAILIHGVLWGLAHAPLIYFGFNYGSDYWCAPLTGILMMILVCVVLGTWLAYVTIQSKSIIPACIFHGASNVIGEMAAMVSFMSINPLLGPNPTGLIGLSGLLIGAVILIFKQPRYK